LNVEVPVEIDQNRTYAVISGDIIGSSKLPPPERAELPDVMKQASNDLRAFMGQVVPLDVDIFAGDSWQLLVSEPGEALRAALFYRSSIIAATQKKIDTRLVIALGKVDFVPGERVSEGDGEAFRLSGKVLRESVGKQQMRFAAGPVGESETWDATLGLLDVIVSRWSAREAQAVLGALQGWSHAEIAARCTPPIERQTVTRFLAAANWNQVSRVVDTFSATNPSNG
jgi:hypothetical protein